MGNIIIEAKNVYVKYITGDLRNIGLKEYLVKKLTRSYKVESFMAVNGVSFTLEQGDMLGIIGTNGAGKSTLLKVVTQIMRPTKGYVRVNGKIAALLELGSGFDGELNLKENAYLRGAMLGYTREFMDKKYPEILEFSELKDFENRPFKQLSSGMKSRIAFSIASMVEPEILILDEVLSVGDGAFRDKSEAKMKEIIKSGKATILVSHSIPQIRRLCNKVLWLDHGRQIALGETQSICDKYELFLKTGELPKIAKKPVQTKKSASNSKAKAGKPDTKPTIIFSKPDSSPNKKKRIAAGNNKRIADISSKSKLPPASAEKRAAVNDIVSPKPAAPVKQEKKDKYNIDDLLAEFEEKRKKK